jgi:hypothetical protein
MIFDDVKHLKETGLGGLGVIHDPHSESFCVLHIARSLWIFLLMHRNLYFYQR